MNRKELKIEMLRHNETGNDLAKALGISRSSLSNKMCGKYGRVFTQKEIAVIVKRYSLTPERISDIFFT